MNCTEQESEFFQSAVLDMADPDGLFLYRTERAGASRHMKGAVIYSSAGV